jgi:hypothetical protein
MNTLLLIQIGFIALTIVFFGLLFYELNSALMASAIEQRKKNRIRLRSIIALIFWFVFTSVWSLSGKMGDFSLFPLNMVPVLLVPMITIVYLAFYSKTTQVILTHIPNHRLVRLQVFRVFVEILLWLLLLENLMPVQMSFEGRNFDILAGLTAPVIALLSYHQKISKTAMILWNIAGLGLLINIVTVAILSMPGPFRVFMNVPANTIVAQFPIALLPAFLVPLAYGLHFLSLRKLMLKD